MLAPPTAVTSDGSRNKHLARPGVVRIVRLDLPVAIAPVRGDFPAPCVTRIRERADEPNAHTKGLVPRSVASSKESLINPHFRSRAAGLGRRKCLYGNLARTWRQVSNLPIFHTFRERLTRSRATAVSAVLGPHGRGTMTPSPLPTLTP